MRDGVIWTAELQVLRSQACPLGAAAAQVARAQ
jgi:hypothetical protein